jgi:hypothetical protein
MPSDDAILDSDDAQSSDTAKNCKIPAHQNHTQGKKDPGSVQPVPAVLSPDSRSGDSCTVTEDAPKQKVLPLFSKFDPYPDQEVMLCCMVGPGLIDPARGVDNEGRLIKPGFVCLGVVRYGEVKAAKKRFMEQMGPYFEDSVILPYHIYEIPVCKWAPMPPDSGIVEKTVYSLKDLDEVANMENEARVKDKEKHEQRVAEIRERRKRKFEEFQKTLDEPSKAIEFMSRGSVIL